MKIKRVTIVVRPGVNDQVSFELEGPSPFPELEAQNPGEYAPSASLEVRRGYGLEWVKKIVDPETPIRVISSSVKGQLK